MNPSQEMRTGWIVSLAVHAILLLVFFLVSLPQVVQNQEFVEVMWGAPVAAAAAGSQLGTEKASIAAPLVKEPRPEQTVMLRKASQPVVLPERRMTDPSEDVMPMQKAEKRDVVAEGTAGQKAGVTGTGEREATGRGIGDREEGLPTKLPPGEGGGTAPGTGGFGGNVASGIPYSIEWMKGGTRRKISGDLPRYPKGVNVEAQIKILTVVLPDGSVKSTQPAQKANTALEDAAMKEVRLWKFEPLRSSQPQNEQTCVITFLFKLK